MAVTFLTNEDKVILDGQINKNAQDISSLSEGNVPSTDQPYMQLVTDAEGKKVWEEKPFYTVYGEKNEKTFSDIVWSNEQAVLPAADFRLVEGTFYTVFYNGKEYAAYAVSSDGAVVITLTDGNLASGEEFIVFGQAGDDCMMMHLNPSNGRGNEIIIRWVPETSKLLYSKYLPAASTTERGAVIYGIGYDKCARIVETNFASTAEEIERAYSAYRLEGAVWKFADDIVLNVNGSLFEAGEMSIRVYRGDGSEYRENLIVAKMDQNDEVSIERVIEYPDELRISGGGKKYKITVDDSGTLITTEVTD